MKAETNTRSRKSLRLPRAVYLFALVLFGALCVWASPRASCEDTPVFLRWMGIDLHMGLIKGYQLAPYDYPPLARVVLAAVGRLAELAAIEQAAALRISLIASLWLSGLVFWLVTHKRWLTLGLLLGLLVNNVTMGYLDAYVVPFVILAIASAKHRYWSLTAIFITIASFIKWQPIMIAPFVLAYSARELRSEENGKRIWSLAARIAVPIVTIVAIVLLAYGSVVIKTLLLASRNPFISGNALNMGWIYTVALHLVMPLRFGWLGSGETLIMTQDWTIVLVPKLLFGVLYLLVIWRFIRTPSSFVNMVYYALGGYMTYFLFNIGVHENHPIFAIVLAAFLASHRRLYLWVFIGVALYANTNLVYFYGFTGHEQAFPKTVLGVWVACGFTLIGALLYAWFWRTLPSADCAHGKT